MLGYKRLEALVHQVTDQKGSMDPALSLHLPTREEESINIEKAVTDFNVTNFARWKTADQRDENDSGSINLGHHTKLKVDKTKSSLDIVAVNESQASTAGLLKVLIDNLAHSNCGCIHVARFQVCDSLPSTDMYGGLRHKIFMSTCQTLGGWQETYCEVVSQL
jgi:hypothetical protein